MGSPRKFPIRGKLILHRIGTVEERTTSLPENEWDVEAAAPVVLSQKSIADAPIYA
jgi:hypothetical protein